VNCICGLYIHAHTYIQRERERERLRGTDTQTHTHTYTPVQVLDPNHDDEVELDDRQFLTFVILNYNTQQKSYPYPSGK